MNQAAIGDAREVIQAKIAQLSQPADFLQTLVGDFHAVQIQNFELREVLQIIDALVSHQGAQQCETPEVFHARQSRHGLVGDIGVAEVEKLQVHEGGQALGILHGAERHAQVVELGERRHAHQTRVPEIQPCKRGQTGLESFQMLHAGEEVEYFVGVGRFDVAGRAPHARRKEQLAQAGQVAQRIEFFGISDGAVHIDTHQVHGADGQCKGVAGIFGSAVEQHPPAFAQHPEGDVAFGDIRVGIRSQQPKRRAADGGQRQKYEPAKTDRQRHQAAQLCEHYIVRHGRAFLAGGVS